LLFIDNPAGVGFSFAAFPEDMSQNDWSCSDDLFKFITQFYGDWPELLHSPLYIGGNSQGGGYAPFLAYQIHLNNQRAEMLKGLNMTVYPLKGMIIANGVTDFKYDVLTTTTPYTYAAYSIIPASLLKEFQRLGCIIKNPLVYPEWRPTGECRPVVIEFFRLHNTDVNIYDLLQMPLVPWISNRSNETFEELYKTSAQL
jgi:hypothetical protein